MTSQPGLKGGRRRTSQAHRAPGHAGADDAAAELSTSVDRLAALAGTTANLS
jgi:hypothetical protein